MTGKQCLAQDPQRKAGRNIANAQKKRGKVEYGARGVPAQGGESLKINSMELPAVQYAIRVMSRLTKRFEEIATIF
jgi:hypothetical protein